METATNLKTLQIADKLLFTPGPLTTSATVKAAMMHDAGSRDSDFLAIVRSIRERLLDIGGAEPGEYECVLTQGSGTFAIESVISSALSRDVRLLVLVNGAYGRRIAQVARVHSIDTEILECAENRKVSPREVTERLAEVPAITHVAVVHCETTTGSLNLIEEIGAEVARAGAVYIVDAMSSFGAIPISLAGCHADILISPSNKCVEGVPGFAFVLGHRCTLEAAKGRARCRPISMRNGPVSKQTNGSDLRRRRMSC
jgi:2-aminoethylphosphonate-pyruvate transaminase